MINYLTFAVSILLSAVAAYFSIVGLGLIFSAALIPVIVMGSTLEVSKLVSVSWLYRNWDICPATIKGYLIAAIATLMLITSMGTFGYLSRAHIEQSSISGDTSLELNLLEQELQSEKGRIDNAQRALASLDRLVAESSTENAVNLRQRQTKERKQLLSEISDANSTIKELSAKALPLRKENLKQEVEVGPIKYIAELTIGDSNQADLERAVRWVIILLVLVFDPLAVVLLIAANIGFKNTSKNTTEDTSWLEKINMLKNKKKSGTIEIDEDQIAMFK